MYPSQSVQRRVCIRTCKRFVSRNSTTLGAPSPQSGSSHGQPQAGSPSTPGPVGGVRRGKGWREWRRGDPTLINSLWKSKTPLVVPRLTITAWGYSSYRPVLTVNTTPGIVGVIGRRKLLQL
ncbi:hypothetical protein J6590_056873 [Homalodisca vitripennis]|nr:hypothetical protein J6590_056873 [Homalodisca vitripennis]